MQETKRAAAQKYRYRQRRKIWRNIVSIMACIVVFCTTYALILPAITMEKDTFCGMEAHVHEAECYTGAAAMVCDPAQGTEIPVLHTHDEFCYDGDQLLCTLPELAGHVHAESCYETVTTEVHIHDESCSGFVRGALLCEVAEEAGHSHGEGCYVAGETLICTETEREGYAHGDTCYAVSEELTCTLAEGEGHSHGDACYTVSEELSCTLAEGEGHSHGDTCYTVSEVMICTLTEGEDHSHGEACVAKTNNLTCTIPEAPAHAHAEACRTQIQTLTCALAEAPAHTHGETCYTQNKTLTCALAEEPGHAHTDTCYEQVLTCEVPETEGHAHEDACYEMVTDIICGKEEVAEAVTQTNLVCTLAQIAPHVHNEGCVDCTIQNAAVHQHTTECVQVPMTEENLVCDKEVHEHTLECYSDPNADLESAKDWEETFSKAELTGVWREDVLTIAKTQLGYAESSKNYIVNESGETKGYTRYGAWYGIPYGDWCAMYVSFCLDYAGVEGMPLHCNCPAWINELTDAGLYRSADAYTPEPGDVIFFDWNADGSSDHVGLVAELDEASVKTIEGNSGNMVCYQTYDLTDSRIMGYGRMVHQVTEEEQAAIDQVIEMIQAMPSADEIDAKIEEFEEAEDYEGEEAWLTEVYQQVGEVYREYYYLGEELQPHVTNRDKLLELEYIWSVMPLATRTIYLDGTCGGVYSLRGSDNKQIAHNDGNNPAKNPYTLPTTWKSPSQYSYVLNGWYDITHGQYYAPGAQVVITEDTVFYADWVAESYDNGTFNIDVSDTISTDDFITTRMFDYNQLINMYSLVVSGKRTSSQNSFEKWSLTTGKALNGNASLNFAFRDWDATTKLTWTNDYPEDDSRNTYHEGNGVTTGIVSSSIGVAQRNEFGEIDTTKPKVIPTEGAINDSILNLLFGEINTQKMGRFYLGTGDHFYHFGTDPSNEELYGYYYYDSEYNAASYNQSGQRFYVYDYRERTSNAITDTGDPNNPKYTDFLPLNSANVNTNGKAPLEGTLSGGGRVYSYDSQNDYTSSAEGITKGNESNSDVALPGTNMWFGMRSDIEFYLPNKPGTIIDGEYGNKGINGKDMTFEFSGDDDVWVYVDGELLLDLGGIHGVETGKINFSTGEISMAQYTGNETVMKTYEDRLLNLSSGMHTLTIFYLERGDSLSNCRILFNISPRYTMTLQKEDVITHNQLDGARFDVFLDQKCTKRAEYWTSKAAYENGEDPVPALLENNTPGGFEIVNGQGSIWGLAAGNTYYIKEIKAPAGYELPSGLIKLNLSVLGEAEYEVLSMVADANGNTPSPGFSAYGFRVDPETEEAFLVVTNGNIEETTSVTVQKVWADGTARPDVPVYLLLDGQRVRETAILSSRNNWYYTWQHLPVVYKEDASGNPELDANGKKIPLQYTVEEGVVSGYVQQGDPVAGYVTFTSTTWKRATTFEAGKTYIICNEAGTTAIFGDRDTSKESGYQGIYRWYGTGEGESLNLGNVAQPQNIQWTVTPNGNGFHLKNGITYMNIPSNSNWINSGEGSNCSYPFYFDGGKLYVNRDGTNYYFDGMTAYNTGNVTINRNSGDNLLLYEKVSSIQFTAADQATDKTNPAYRITNAVSNDVIDIQVEKYWVDHGQPADVALYEQLNVPIELQVEVNNTWRSTGQTGTLNLKNGWKYTFEDVPAGKNYRVRETWNNNDWTASYVINTQNGYLVQITNTYNRTIQIPVVKQWQVTDSQRKELTLELYAAPGDNQAAGEDPVATLTLNSANNWTGSFEVLAPAANESYYIYESTEGYYVTYSNQTSIFIDNKSCAVGKVTFDDTGTPQTVTVTNQVLLSLPETGGIGTVIYTAGGLLLMMAAVLLLLHKKSPKRRKEDASSC